jgi:hypothetical protein
MRSGDINLKRLLASWTTRVRVFFLFILALLYIGVLRRKRGGGCLIDSRAVVPFTPASVSISFFFFYYCPFFSRRGYLFTRLSYLPVS